MMFSIHTKNRKRFAGYVGITYTSCFNNGSNVFTLEWKTKTKCIFIRTIQLMANGNLIFQFGFQLSSRATFRNELETLACHAIVLPETIIHRMGSSYYVGESNNPPFAGEILWMQWTFQYHRLTKE